MQTDKWVDIVPIITMIVGCLAGILVGIQFFSSGIMVIPIALGTAIGYLLGYFFMRRKRK